MNRPADHSQETLFRGARCREDHCVTCSDEAVAARVVRLREGDLADVDAGRGRVEEVSVALVDARVGDIVLVHAKEAIGLVP